MDLKDFIKNVLMDVINAVEETRVDSVRDLRIGTGKEVRSVEFDIAISVESGSSTAGKAGIKVLQFVEGGADISKESKNSTVSRVKFGVDIDYLTKEESIRLTNYSNKLNSKSDISYI